MDAYYGCEGQFYVMIIFWLLLCRVVAYNVWWDGHYCVDANMFGNWKLLWCSIFAVDFFDVIMCVLFFGCHSSPVNNFQNYVVVGKVC
jgi:hypothetical protein